MKRFVVGFGVLAAVLSAVLYWRLRVQAQERTGPPGSSGVIENVRVDVAARIGARISATHADEGDAVKAGQLLAELDCAEMDALVAEAEARLAAARLQIEPVRRQAAAAAAQADAADRQAKAAAEQAAAAQRQAEAADRQAQAARRQVGAVRAQRDNAERQRDRLATLESQQVVTPAEVEGLATATEDLDYRVGAASSTASAAEMSASAMEGQAHAAAEQAGAAAEQARAAREQAGAATEQVRAVESQLAVAEAALGRARVGQAECRVTAPRGGTVTLKAHEAGEVVLPGSTLFEITDPTATTVVFYVSNADLGRVAPGMRVTVTADAFPERRFEGTVRWISPEAEFTPRTVQTRDDRDRLVYALEADIENPDGALRAGMPVEVTVVGGGP